MRITNNEKNSEPADNKSVVELIQTTIDSLNSQLESLEKTGEEISATLATEIKKNVERAISTVSKFMGTSTPSSRDEYSSSAKIDETANAPLDPWVYESRKKSRRHEKAHSCRKSRSSRASLQSDAENSNDSVENKKNRHRHSHKSSRHKHRSKYVDNDISTIISVSCDSCQQEISDLRWKCIDCPDFDLCQNCKFNHSLINHGHPLYAIPPFYRDVIANRDDSGYEVVCNLCEATINGVRWNCNICEDIDFCSKCRNNSVPFHTNYNEIDHALQASYHSNGNLLDPNPQSNEVDIYIGCDNCGSRIDGEIFKCDICKDFDLCIECFPKLNKIEHAHNEFVLINPSSTRFEDSKVSENKPDSEKSHKKSKKNKTEKIKSTTRIDEIKNSINLIAKKNQKLAEKIHKKVQDNLKKSSKSHKEKLSSNKKSSSASASESEFDKKDSAPNNFSQRSFSHSSTTNNTFNPDASSSMNSRHQHNLSRAKSTRDSIMDIQKRVFRESEQTIRNISKTVMETPEVRNALNWGYSFVNGNTHSPRSHSNHQGDNIQNNMRLYYESQINLSAFFVEDLTIPDNTIVGPNEKFVKIWSIANVGDVKWPEGTKIVFLEGTSMGEYGKTEFPVVIGNTYEKTSVAVDMVSPSSPGRYVSKWRLSTQNGGLFGDLIWCDILVESPDSNSLENPKASPVTSQNDIETTTYQLGNVSLNNPHKNFHAHAMRSHSNFGCGNRYKSRRESRRETLAEYTNSLTETLTPVFESLAKVSADIIQDIIKKGTEAQNSYKESKSSKRNHKSSEQELNDDTSRDIPSNKESEDGTISQNHSVPASATNELVDTEPRKDSESPFVESAIPVVAIDEPLKQVNESERIPGSFRAESMVTLSPNENEDFDVSVAPSEPNTSQSPLYTDILANFKSEIIKEDLELISRRSSLNRMSYPAYSPSNSLDGINDTAVNNRAITTSLPSLSSPPETQEITPKSPAIIRIEPAEGELHNAMNNNMTASTLSIDKEEKFHDVEIGFSDHSVTENKNAADEQENKPETEAETKSESDFEMVYSVHEKNE
ncbi:Next to BRCA1 gene 1 protein [Smittium culicis]|uniref:Next to BRCA1 gene 1 protein n=1 Tax=Smittium culicis TaxID=133412 RepID=A0A1R1XKL8_9FUNG|nr:Next to BRCA1 gene 1 protein [Smittium culicis]